MQNTMLRYFLDIQPQAKLIKFFNKNIMVVEESIHVVFYESNNSLQGRESVVDDVGLNFSMGIVQIEEGDPQQENEMDSKKEEKSPLTLPPPSQLEQGESSEGLPRE